MSLLRGTAGRTVFQSLKLNHVKDKYQQRAVITLSANYWTPVAHVPAAPLQHVAQWEHELVRGAQQAKRGRHYPLLNFWGLL
jgi:hypothetical protein